MKISVIIPTYNEEKDVENCILSLMSQSSKPEEIIFIDDGSTDKTRDIIKKYPVILLTQKHLGPGPARNLGASIAKGDMLVFVDADMTFDKDFLRNLTKNIREGKSKGVFNTQEFVANYDSNVWARCWNYNQGLKNKLRMDPNNIHDSEDFRAILKSEFDRVGGFSNTGYTDSRTLVGKLGYRPTPESAAISYHANPSSLQEIFKQAKWIGKRRTKFGVFGKIINLVRYSMPMSLFLGLIKSIQFREPKFIIFKLVYDWGYTCGICSSIFYILNTAK